MIGRCWNCSKPMIYYSRHRCRELVVHVDKFLPNIPITTQTEEPMPTEKQIARQINNLLGELVGLSKYPDEDPCSDGDVIWFEKTYPDGTYTYVAIRVDDGRWFTTSTATASKCFANWGDMCKWMGTKVKKVYLMFRGETPLLDGESARRVFYDELHKQLHHDR